MLMFDKILISQCFLGNKVRYDGSGKLLVHPLISLWQQQSRLISICPEMAGGLPVPRDPAEINPLNGQVITKKGLNVTPQFTKGADCALSLCLTHKIRFALLKESSPSCGSTFIYDGKFNNKKIAGAGITTQLLRQQGIKVFSEDNLAELVPLLDKFRGISRQD